MIAPEKMNDALHALQMLIVQARQAAVDADAKEAGILLDDVEWLPSLLSDDIDQTREFQLALEGIVQKHPQCRYILEQFLGRATKT